MPLFPCRSTAPAGSQLPSSLFNQQLTDPTDSIEQFKTVMLVLHLVWVLLRLFVAVVPAEAAHCSSDILNAVV